MEFLRKLLILTIFLTPLSMGTVLAQPTTVKADVTDAKAKALLDKVKRLYDGYTTFESNFKVENKLAEQSKPEIMTGKIYQQGEYFRAEFGKDFIMGNGKIIWQKV